MLKGGLEDNVLTLVCHNDKYASAIVMQLKADLFSTRNYRKVAEVAYRHIEKFGKAPGAHIRDLLEDDLRRGEEGVLLGKILDDMDALHRELQPDYVLSQLDRFIALRKISSAIEAASDAVAAGDVSAAQAALYSGDIGVKQSPGIWLHKPEQALAFLDEKEEDFFPSGIPTLDARGVRPRRKTMFLFIGPKKIGKSTWLTEIGKQALLHRRKVLHITLENGEELTSKKYVQALFAMTDAEASTIRVPIFKRDSLGRCTSIDFDTRVPEHLRPEIRAQVAKRLEALRSKPPLLIKEFPMSSLTIAQLNAFLDSLARTENFVPDMLLLDYPDLMALDTNNLRISTGQLLRELRGIAQARNMALVVPAQGNRTSETARVVNSTMLAEDWSKAGTADIVCSISRTKSEREIGLARIFVDAARTVEDKYLVMISQSYATGQFCIDSVYMNKYIESEIERLVGEEKDDKDGE